jgi:hypothetical protein
MNHKIINKKINNKLNIKNKAMLIQNILCLQI